MFLFRVPLVVTSDVRGAKTSLPWHLDETSLFRSVQSALLWYVNPTTGWVLTDTSVSPPGLGAPGEQKAGSLPALHFQLLAQSTWLVHGN